MSSILYYCILEDDKAVLINTILVVLYKDTAP